MGSVPLPLPTENEAKKCRFRKHRETGSASVNRWVEMDTTWLMPLALYTPLCAQSQKWTEWPAPIHVTHHSTRPSYAEWNPWLLFNVCPPRRLHILCGIGTSCIKRITVEGAAMKGTSTGNCSSALGMKSHEWLNKSKLNSCLFNSNVNFYRPTQQGQWRRRPRRRVVLFVTG